MERKYLYICCTFLTLLPCFASNLRAQETMVSGIARDTKTNTLNGVSIWIKDSFDGATTDSAGHFTFRTSLLGKHLLLYSAMGYEPDSMTIDLNDSPIYVQLRMRPKVNEIDVVTISVGTFTSGAQAKGISLSALDVVTTAGALADLFAAYQTLPGAQTAFADGGLFVRGGAAAETKMFFDGLIVKQPLNAQAPNLAGRTRLDPFMFKQTAFSSGGYSVQYGQALSSAMIV